MKMFIVDQD